MYLGWTPDFPEEEGVYWFYGYRFGKTSCGFKKNRELMCVKVRKNSNGFSYIADGNFMFEKEVEEPLFISAILPDLPITKGE